MQLLDGEPVPGPNAGVPCRRLFLLVEGADDVVDQAVIVGVEAEGASRLNDAQEIGDDHHERPGKEHNEQDALRGHALNLGLTAGRGAESARAGEDVSSGALVEPAGYLVLGFP